MMLGRSKKVNSLPNGGIINVSAGNTVIKKQDGLPLPDGRYVEIAIEDHGTGIPRSHFDKIFDPYFTTKQKGNGLGLATSYSIIKNHGGTITFESELGVGTTFNVYLPATKENIKEEKEQQHSPYRWPMAVSWLWMMKTQFSCFLAEC